MKYIAFKDWHDDLRRYIVDVTEERKTSQEIEIEGLKWDLWYSEDENSEDENSEDENSERD